MKTDIKEGDNCPYCEIGKVKMRRGKFGDFLGCDQYPSCCFVQRPKKKESREDMITEEWVRSHGAVIDPVI